MSARDLRILYLTPGCFDKGGISRYNRYQIRALRELGCEVRVYSVWGRRSGDFEEPFAVTYAAGGIGARHKLAYLARVAAEAVRWRPRLVLAAHVNLAAAACVLARAVGAPSVLDVYGLEVWSGLRPDAAWGLRSATRVVADCHFTARYLDAEGLRRGPTSVIWDCVDLGRFSPGRPRREVLARYGISDPAEHVNVLTLGRMREGARHKGYDRLLAAFARVRDPRVRLVYAGGGELARELRASAAAAGLGDRVCFTGPVHEDDLVDVYRSAAVFSLVSDRGKGRGEGLPLTPLEAAACGVPIIVGNQDGSQEAVVEGENGFVIDPFDLEAHARRLGELAASPELRDELGRAGRRRIERELSYETFRARHRDLLASLGTPVSAR